MGEKKLVLVDGSGEPLGEAGELACHTGRGLLHLAFTVLLINGEGDLIIQRRSAEKRLWPLYWEATCSGHPRVNQDVQTAAACRLEEELGFTTLLGDAGRFTYRAEYGDEGVEWEVCHLMVGSAGRLIIQADPREVEEYRVASPRELMREMRERPEEFAPWLFPAVELWKKVVRWGG